MTQHGRKLNCRFRSAYKAIRAAISLMSRSPVGEPFLWLFLSLRMSTCRQINAANVKLAIMRTAIEISKSTAGSATVEFRNALICRAIFFSFADLRHLTVHENEKLLLY